MVNLIDKTTIVICLDAEAIYITKSGWDDYHVIRELGEIGISEYARLNGLDVFKKYGVNPNILLNNTIGQINLN